MWIIGDNMVASSYRVHFKKLNTYEAFMKENFQICVFCGSKYTSQDVNPLSRVLNALIAAINDEVYLPEFVLFVLDADLIDFLNYSGYGVSTILGSWLEYLFKEVNDCIKLHIRQLP